MYKIYFVLWTIMNFYFLESTLNPSYILTFEVRVSAARKKRPQPEGMSLYLRGSSPSIVDFFETALDSY
jgi:hypothetical protein